MSSEQGWKESNDFVRKSVANGEMVFTAEVNTKVPLDDGVTRIFLSIYDGYSDVQQEVDLVNEDVSSLISLLQEALSRSSELPTSELMK